MKKNLSGMLRILCCVTVLLCAMTVFASADGVDKEVKKYAETLAKENGAELGSMIKEGDGSGNYKLGSLSASEKRGLYVVELQTIVGYERLDGN